MNVEPILLEQLERAIKNKQVKQALLLLDRIKLRITIGENNG